MKHDYLPVGTIVPFAGSISSLPSGWKLCDGTPVSRDKYGNLFAVIEYFWGRDSTMDSLNRNYFNLPDLEGRFLRGVGGNKDINPDQDKRDAAKPGGNVNNAVGSVQSDATRRPNTDFETDNPGNHVHVAPTNAGSPGESEVAVEQRNVDLIRGADTSPAGAHSHKITRGGDKETRPQNANVYWIIRVE
jgi:microcystin-dependent protein